jgi:hypothetical protein
MWKLTHAEVEAGVAACAGRTSSAPQQFSALCITGVLAAAAAASLV